ncbi:hypothetical protein P175DRAFT_0432969 [Aspergillus ochraceoroseus IBT 24754]|uniref:F-box domain-containing protein n=3 Tax=Aspergillus subgen. Nidulantes TaxID=2720870 RepID=A0A0F8X5C3_9EURO|nr:uncharacterized protein P175DRAFT_0432969 [Aspergillus ochraceoroseus IBT 24754]KKK16781.1 hypothetical protein AOCH_005499 [Aspergillus ochraceoroseus]KKK18767.1 hypothetical protein ARAM_004301 [Aspergillus rambellii]PTU23447.1 hypothetical protein P175DRAFT_0432969 [Aspergillus ochraceoroseus IBT 24754]
MDKIKSLPLEIVLHILSYLPCETLLAFGETSRANYNYHILSLKRLRLGVFEKRVHSTISLLQAGWATPDQLACARRNNEHGSSYIISVIQPENKPVHQELWYKHPYRTINSRRCVPIPRSKSWTLEQLIRAQNLIFTRVLTRYGPTLLNLEFMAYDLDLDGAKALGLNCQHSLRHLALRFEHAHIRDGPVRPSTWLHPAPGSEAWNMLVGVGRYKNIGLCNLETLIMERAGITPWQLIMLVKNNPNLTVLKLRTCRGAQPEFLNWLGGIESDSGEAMTQIDSVAPGAKLKILWLEHCHRLLSHSIEEYEDLPGGICDFGLEWVRGLANLQSLSFSESANIPSEYIDRANRALWGIPEVILPYSLYNENSAIEVDPRWS